MTELLEHTGPGGSLTMAWDRLENPLPDERIRLRRLQSTAVRQLACRAAARLLDCRAARLSVAAGVDIPPALLYAGRPLEGLCVTLSHSRRWIAAAVSHGPRAAGIDVQQLDGRQPHRLAAYMGWTDLLYGDRETPVDPTEGFTHIWTVWEAAFKCDSGQASLVGQPSFARLVTGLRPGKSGAWECGSHGAISRQLAERCWLSLVVSGSYPHGILAGSSTG